MDLLDVSLPAMLGSMLVLSLSWLQILIGRGAKISLYTNFFGKGAKIKTQNYNLSGNGANLLHIKLVDLV